MWSISLVAIYRVDRPETAIVIDRGLKRACVSLLFILNREYQLVELKASIQMKTHEDINQQQKEYFLQQQIKTIQEELGGNINELEIKELREKASRKKWPAEVAQVFEKELRNWNDCIRNLRIIPYRRNMSRISLTCRGTSIVRKFQLVSCPEGLRS